MNLKERGITVGDLLIIIISIISTVFIINKVKDNEKKVEFNIPINGISIVKLDKLV